MYSEFLLYAGHSAKVFKKHDLTIVFTKPLYGWHDVIFEKKNEIKEIWVLCVKSHRC